VTAPISRYPVPALAELPDDIRARILEVQEKAGFVPNVFVTLAHRPDEFRAFFAYHDALMQKDGGLSKAERGDDRRRDVRARTIASIASSPTARSCASTRRIRSLPTRSPSTIARPTFRSASAQCLRSR
jgi:alkylhydroperoxidase family enzyme